MNKNKVPDLSQYKNMSEWVLDNNSKPNENKLPLSVDELGPRMTLSLYKIEYKGKLLFHAHKSETEINETIKEFVAKEELREERKKK